MDDEDIVRHIRARLVSTRRGRPYLYLGESGPDTDVSRTVEAGDTGVSLDFDIRGHLIGIEFDATDKLPHDD